MKFLNHLRARFVVHPKFKISITAHAGNKKTTTRADLAGRQT